MSRVSYFKNVSPSVGLDATQNQMLVTLSGQIATKADTSDVMAGFAQKVSTYVFDAALSTKADKTELNFGLLALDEAKAEKTALTSGLALKLDLSVADTALTLLSNTKADKTAITARISNEAVFYESVKNSIALHDAAGVELNYVALGLVPA